MSQSVGVASTRATAATWACGSRISVERSIHARRVWCQSTLKTRSVIESRFVDDDIGGNWSSNCSCHKHLESISIRQLCVNFSSLCWRKMQHPARVDKFYEGSVGARRGCDFAEKENGCSRLSSGNEQSLHLHVHRRTLSGLETRR